MKEKHIIMFFIGVLIIIGIIIKKINIQEGLIWKDIPDYGYYGNDIVGSNGSIENIGSLDEAKTKCANDSRCLGFGRVNATGRYNLKSSLQNYATVPGGYTAYNKDDVWTEQTNTDYPGNDIGSGTGYIEEVKAKCANDPNCKGFNWNSTTKNYNYKSVLGTINDRATGLTFYTKVVPTTTPGPTARTMFTTTPINKYISTPRSMFTSTPLPTDPPPNGPPPPTLETTDPMIIKNSITTPYDSIKTINYILKDNLLTYKKKVNAVKQFGITASTESSFYNILFNSLYNDEQIVDTLIAYIERKYKIKECLTYIEPNINDGITFPFNSIKAINYVLKDNILTNQKKVNIVKQFGITASNESSCYSILFNSVYNDETKVEALINYIEGKYRFRECQITSTSPPR